MPSTRFSLIGNREIGRHVYREIIFLFAISARCAEVGIVLAHEDEFSEGNARIDSESIHGFNRRVACRTHNAVDMERHVDWGA